jgi:hypothetical protein
MARPGKSAASHDGARRDGARFREIIAELSPAFGRNVSRAREREKEGEPARYRRWPAFLQSLAREVHEGDVNLSSDADWAVILPRALLLII